MYIFTFKHLTYIAIFEITLASQDFGKTNM